MTTAQRSTAASLIASKGQALTITRNAAGAYNPATGSAAITSTSQTGYGAVLPLNPFRKNGTSIVEGDQQLLLSAIKSDGTALTKPHVNDVVTLADASKATIVAVDPLEPAGLSIFYDCVIRRAA